MNRSALVKNEIVSKKINKKRGCFGCCFFKIVSYYEKLRDGNTYSIQICSISHKIIVSNSHGYKCKIRLRKPAIMCSSYDGPECVPSPAPVYNKCCLHCVYHKETKKRNYCHLFGTDVSPNRDGRGCGLYEVDNPEIKSWEEVALQYSFPVSKKG
jgi:hypothetical protein